MSRLIAKRFRRCCSVDRGANQTVAEVIADVWSLKKRPLANAALNAAKGLRWDVLKLVSFAAGDEPHRKDSAVRIVFRFAYRGGWHDGRSTKRRQRSGGPSRSLLGVRKAQEGGPGDHEVNGFMTTKPNALATDLSARP
ncbi:hypothetical protein MES4922_10186 [Mesorhizobium ventifaucium]|uniref:Uncharacterized protein n=1 Tax=Mesorhizobium ventifaucium TaxID=666020 RepID=A0ABM9DDU8_9HYPH|nr:hypothetical protein MES4922_10186 [Mesorhizobium ventifaucium]